MSSSVHDIKFRSFRKNDASSLKTVLCEATNTNLHFFTFAGTAVGLLLEIFLSSVHIMLEFAMILQKLNP